MSFLTGTAAGELPTLIRDLWPYDRLSKDPATRAECEAWEAVPHDIGELADWLIVVPRKPRTDKSRPFQVVHALTEDDTVRYEVSLRLQGIVQECDLHPIGNWDGTAFGAQNAVQRLVLHGRGFEDQWLQTLRQLNKLITVVTRLAEPRHDVHLLSVTADTVLPLQRRVFDRVQRHDPNTSLSALDPSISNAHANTIRSMVARWVLASPLAVGAVRAAALRRANHIVIRPGNFVDVLASIEIVRKHRGTRVFLKLDRVVQLDDSEDTIQVPGASNRSEDEGDDVVIQTNADSIFAADADT